jgi:hypothetical protein
MMVTFAPKSVGAGVGMLTVTDAYRTQAVSLSGTGVAPAGVSLSPVSALTFAATGVGLSAAAQTVTLTNNGGMPLMIQSVGVTGDFAMVSGSDTCGASLSAGSMCSAQVVFVPTAAGTRSGSLTVVDSTGSSPQSLQLTGTGVDFALTVNGSAAQTITAGSEAVYGLLLTSAAGVPGTVSLTCSGAPAYSTCLVNPVTGTLGGSTLVTVTVATNVALLRGPGPRRDRDITWLVGLLPVGLLGLRRGRRRRMGRMAMLGCLLLMAGCGASRLIPATSSSGGGTATNPTPSGTYNLVVSGASAGLTRSVGLTLVVQ